MADIRPGAYNYKTLLCKNIPDLFLDKFVARSHFGRFGTLVNFVLRPRRMTCTVSYGTEAEAERALREGDTFNGRKFDISYAENENSPAQKTEEWVDPEVQAELSALSAPWRNEYSAGKATTKRTTSFQSQSSSQASTSKLPHGGSGGGGGGGGTTTTTNRDRPHTQQEREMESLLRRPAHTAEERYRVLDARDKLLRLNQSHKRSQNQKRSSTATEGYCPDMCPEKERALREFQRQVAVYELQPNSDELICHERALKQYSRSSADQETPLAHELRGESALHMTMSYLMHEMMDISENPDLHLGDWFHFVWDRTRSIRKEITQQELCSLGVVKLVEQCARFHIHCAARLVAEDPSVFDSKINAENLTKCLQTLKYMYHDLRLKGVQCPKEAEFRGYIVLLNLADANFLWDIGQLPAELQSCKDVRQAIQFYLALQDTNIVRFFQLLRDKETSYLSACILVTYFTRLRVLALQRLIMAYRAPRKNEVSSLPLSYVSQILGCGDTQEAAEFVHHYGLKVNSAGRVPLTRMHTVESEYKLRRQIMLVESKRQLSVGECISGEPLPPKSLYLNHRPHNSFNEHGVLKSIAWEAKDQLPGMQAEMEAAANRRSPPPARTTQPFHRPPNADSFFKVPMAAPAAPAAGPSTTFRFVLPQPTRQTQLEEQQRLAEQRFKAAEMEALRKAEEEEAERVRQEKLRHLQEAEELKRRQEELQKQLQEQQELERQRRLELARIKEEKEMLRQERLREERERREKEQREKEQRVKERREMQLKRKKRQTELTNQFYGELLNGAIKEMCQQELALQKAVYQCYQDLVENVVSELAEKEHQQAIYEKGLMRLYWRRWRNYRGIQQKKDVLFNQLPLSFVAETPKRLLDERHVEESVRLIRRYRQGEACDYKKLLAGLEEKTWLKLDLWRVLAQCLPVKVPGARRFYKLLIMLPAGDDGLQLNNDLDRGLLQQPQAPDARMEPGGYIRGLAQNVALSVVKVRDHWDPQDLQDADGILCLAEASHFPQLGQRLKQLVQASGCPDVALILQYPYTQLDDPEPPLEEMGLRHWRIFPLRYTGNNRERLLSHIRSAVEFLGRAKIVPKLQQGELRELLIWHLGQELFRRLKYNDTIRRRCRQSPQYCVRLYNEAVRRMQLVLGEDLRHAPRLPEELRVFVEPLSGLAAINTSRLEYFEPGWETPERRQRIVDLLERAKMPTMRPVPEREEEQCQWVLDYATQSQQEDLVEMISMLAIKCLERTPRDYLGLVEVFATERLQWLLRGEPRERQGLVFKRATMRKCFLSDWYYEFEEPDYNDSVREQLEEQQKQDQAMAQTQVQMVDKLEVQEVISRAEAILERFQNRRILSELNSEKQAKNKRLESLVRRDPIDPETTSKRQRLEEYRGESIHLPKLFVFPFFLFCFYDFYPILKTVSSKIAWKMHSLVAHAEKQVVRPQQAGRLFSVIRQTCTAAINISRGGGQNTGGALREMVTQLYGPQSRTMWPRHMASLVSRSGIQGDLWRPYVSFSTRLERKLAVVILKRYSSMRFLSTDLVTRRSSNCRLPIRSRYAPKTMQARHWHHWRKTNLRPLLLPSSNIWTGFLSNRCYAMKRRSVPQLELTEAEAEHEELIIERCRSNSKLGEVPRRGYEDDEEDSDDSDTSQQQTLELMKPELAAKWVPVEDRGAEPRRDHLLEKLKATRSGRTMAQSSVRRELRRHRRYSHRGRAFDPVPISELEEWRRSEEHLPVPDFQGGPVEQEHLQINSDSSSAQMVTRQSDDEDDEDGHQSPLVWSEMKKMSPWGGLGRVAKQLGSRKKPSLLPTIKAAKSNLLLAEEHGYQGRIRRLRQSNTSVDSLESLEEAEDEEDHPVSESSRARSRQLSLKGSTAKEAKVQNRSKVGEGGVAAPKPTKASSKPVDAAMSRPAERALLKQHLADLLPVSESRATPYRIEYQPNAPTRQLLEQGRCHVPLSREPATLGPVRPYSTVPGPDLERSTSVGIDPLGLALMNLRSSGKDINLHHMDGAKRPRVVQVVKKPSLLTLLGRDASMVAGKTGARRSTSAAPGLVEQTYSKHRQAKERAAPKSRCRSKLPAQEVVALGELQKAKLKRSPTESFRRVETSYRATVNEVPNPFKDLEAPRIMEKAVATSSMQANQARMYQCTKLLTKDGIPSRKEPGSGYARGGLPPKPESKKPLTVHPPRRPEVSPKVQTPDPKDPKMYVRMDSFRKPIPMRNQPLVSKLAARLPPPVPSLKPPTTAAMLMTKEKWEWARSKKDTFEHRWRF
ncbi:protein xmas [Drosophila bipectinata]|uniref:protein xmas n=1 Tax=Drosophila bipectinata TaxID=42026 RepID=UPI0038B2BF03